MKYDIKNITKILWIMYVIAIPLAVATRLLSLGKEIQIIDILSKIFLGCTFSAIANILVNTFVHILRVFINNFYKDESYLTHTLPVTKKQLFLSKYFSSILVILASVLVCILSLFITFYSKEFMQQAKAFLEYSISGFDIPVWLFLTLTASYLFFQICGIMSMVFCAIIKANTYNEQRLFKGLLWFFIYYIGAGIILTLLIGAGFLASGNITSLLAEQLSKTALITLLVLCLIFYFALSVAYYFLALKLFKKGVNVD